MVFMNILHPAYSYLAVFIFFFISAILDNNLGEVFDKKRKSCIIS